MATYTFPAETFMVPGDPEAIAESGRAYGRFSTITGDAASGIRGMDSSSWVGTEGDMFRDQVAEIPPHLDTAHGAFSQASTAVSTFLEVLAAAQRQMSGVRDDAQQTFDQLQAAGNQADQLQEPTDAQVDANPQAMTAYDDVKQDLDNRISGLQGDMDAHIGLANGIRERVNEQARTSGELVRAAGRTSPTADQNAFENFMEDAGNWLSDRIEDLKGFIAEHAEVFRVIADVLRVVGIALVAIGAIIFVVSFWTGVGAGVGLTLMSVGGFIWGAGDALDSTVDWAEGKITGSQLLVSAGLSLVLGAIPFGLGKLAKIPPVRRFLTNTLGPAVGRLLGRARDLAEDTVLPFLRREVLPKIPPSVRRALPPAIREPLEALIRREQLSETARRLNVEDDVARRLFERTDIDVEQAIRDFNALEESGRVAGAPARQDDLLRDVLRNLGSEDPGAAIGAAAELRAANQLLDGSAGVQLAPDSNIALNAVRGEQLDLGNGQVLDIGDVPEADLVYQTADGAVHLDEVKATAQTLANKLRDEPQQLERMLDWQTNAGQVPREVGVRIDTDEGWTGLFSLVGDENAAGRRPPTSFAINELIDNNVPVTVGSHQLAPSHLEALRDATLEAAKDHGVVKNPGPWFAENMPNLDAAEEFLAPYLNGVDIP